MTAKAGAGFAKAAEFRRIEPATRPAPRTATRSAEPSEAVSHGVVLASFLLVAQDLVSVADFLEALFLCLVAFGGVGPIINTTSPLGGPSFR